MFYILILTEENTYRYMQRNIKIKMSSEGKMLSGFVNKYLNERGNFKTDVC